MEKTATDILALLNNLGETYPALLTMLEAVAYVGGFFIALFGVLRYRHGKNLGIGVGTSAFVSIAVGVALINSPTVIANISQTLFAGEQCGVHAKFYDYLSKEDCSTSSNYLKPVILFIQFYGFFAFLRGFFLVNRAHKVGMGAQSDDVALKGWMHVFFGFLCIYIIDITKFAFNTLGLAPLSNFFK